MEKRKIEVVKGQHINVDIIKGKKGNFPMGKYGTIFCKLFIPKNVGHIDFGCTCLCKVTEVSKSTISVTVIEVVRSAAANHFALMEKIKGAKAPDQSKAKVKKNLPLADAMEKIYNPHG